MARFGVEAITVCVGDAATWNNGAIRWNLSAINRDHLWIAVALKAMLDPPNAASLDYDDPGRVKAQVR